MNKAVPDSELVGSPIAGRPAGGKICIVTGELDGPFVNGGIGTTNRALAFVLRVLGYEVDVLYTHVGEGKPICLRGEFSDYVDALRKIGITLKCIDNPSHQYDWQARSYLSLQHLLRHRYDVVFFDDMDGTAYYPLLARRTGCPELSTTVMCVTAHSATQWILEQNQSPLTSFDGMRLIEMERRSLELADAVKAPSAYILQKYRDYGWTISDNSIVLPNFVLAEQILVPSLKQIDVQEIVFFGRLETRKGLWMFCRALDRLKYKLGGRLVTFLGKTTAETGEALLRHSAVWPFPIRLLTNFNREQALTYLKRDGRVAVMPSPEDNSPSVILECLEMEIPFIACSGSGGQELINEKGRKANLFAPSVEDLCAKLVDILTHGAVTANPSFDQAELRGMFASWLERLWSPKAKRRIPTTRRTGSPNPILFVIAPPDIHQGQAAAELLRSVGSYGGKVEIEVLATNPAELQKHLASSGESSAIRVSNTHDFERIAGEVALRKSTVLGVCHITQLLPPAWVERALNCFATEKNISALTGMVADPAEADLRSREPYFSDSNGNHRIVRYLTGYSPPLFPLLQETNSGFVLLRSELFVKLSGLPPVDKVYGRLKRMQDWVHEILVALHSCGDRFELAPDRVMEQPVRESPFEVFGLTDLMRSLPSKLYGYAPGSDQSILSGLAIDTGLRRERSIDHEKFYLEVEERIGREISRLPPYTPWEAHARQLALIAYANGQIDLAVDLCAGLAIQGETSKPLDLVAYVRSAAAGQIINVVEAVAAGYRALNVSEGNGLTLWGPRDTRRIEMRASPANSAPAAIVVPSLDLSKITHFTSILETQEKSASKVRFRIELDSHDGLHRWSAEKIVGGGDESIWEIECPTDLRVECSLLLSVEMADWRDSAISTTARWINPRFTRIQGLR